MHIEFLKNVKEHAEKLDPFQFSCEALAALA
jgi:hypothetical protein